MEKVAEIYRDAPQSDRSLGEKIVPFCYIALSVFFIFFSFKGWVLIRYKDPLLEIFPRHIYYGILFFVPNVLFLIYTIIKKELYSRATFTDLAFVALIIWGTISLTYSINVAAAIEGLYFWWIIFLIYYTFIQVFRNYPKISDRYLIVSIVALTLYFLGHYFYYNGSKLINLVSQSEDTFQQTVRHLRSILGSKNVSAMFLFLVFGTYYSLTLTVSNKAYRGVGYLFQAICLISLFIIGSRNVYLSLTVFYSSFFIWNNKSITRQHVYKALLLIGCLIAFVLIVNTSKFIDHLTLKSFGPRVVMWEKSIAYFLDNTNTLIGAGIYQFDILKSLFKLDYHAHPHNDFVRTLLEMGIVGLVLHSLIFISQLFLSMRFVTLSSNEEDKLKVKALVSILLAYQILMIFDGLHYKIAHQSVVMIIWARLHVLVTQESSLVLSRFTHLKEYFVGSFIIGMVAYSAYFLSEKKQHIAGERMMKFDRYDDAYNTLNNINKKVYYDPLKEPIYTQLGNKCVTVETCDNEQELFERSLGNYPYHTETIMKLVDIYIDKKEIDKAFVFLKIIEDKYQSRVFALEKYEQLNKILSE